MNRKASPPSPGRVPFGSRGPLSFRGRSRKSQRRRRASQPSSGLRGPRAPRAAAPHSAPARLEAPQPPRRGGAGRGGQEGDGERQRRRGAPAATGGEPLHRGGEVEPL